MMTEQLGGRYAASESSIVASPSSSVGGRATAVIGDATSTVPSSSSGGGQVCKFMYSCDVPLYLSLSVCGVMNRVSESTMWCSVVMDLMVDGKVVCNRSTYGAPLQTVSTPTGVEESWVAAHTQPRRDELTLGTTYPIRELPSTATLVITVNRVSHHFECVGQCVLPVFTERGVLRQGRRIMELYQGRDRPPLDQDGALVSCPWDTHHRYHYSHAPARDVVIGDGLDVGENSNNRIFTEEGNDSVKEALIVDYEAECTSRATGSITPAPSSPPPPPSSDVIHTLLNSERRYIIIELNPKTEAPVLYCSVRPKEPVRTTLLAAVPPSTRLVPSNTIPYPTSIPWMLAPTDGIRAVPRSTAIDGIVEGVEAKTAQMLAIESSGLDNGAAAPFVHFIPVVDYEAHRIHPSAIKADKLSRKYTSKLPHLPKGQSNVAAAIAAAPRPSAEENRALTRLVRLPVISQPLTLGQKHILLRYCWGLSKQPEALQRVMQAVDWNDVEELEEAQALLDAWAPLGFDDALCLLTPTPSPVETPGAVAILRPPPPPVWYYAVSRLEATSTDDATLSLYLLQLTLALRYEKPSMAPSLVTSDGGQQPQQHIREDQDISGGTSSGGGGGGFGRRPLAQFLVRRATKSLPIATTLFWMLQAERRTPSTSSASTAAPPVVQRSTTPMLVNANTSSLHVARDATTVPAEAGDGLSSGGEASNGPPSSGGSVVNDHRGGEGLLPSSPDTSPIVGDTSPSSAAGGNGAQEGRPVDVRPSLGNTSLGAGDVSEPEMDPDLAGFVRPEVPSSAAAAGQNIDIFSLTAQHLWRELGRSETQNPQGPRIREAIEAQCALRQRLLDVARAVKHAGRARDSIDRRNARLREALQGTFTASGDPSATGNNNGIGLYADLTRPIPSAIAPPLPVDPSLRLVRVDANRSFCIKSSMMPIVLTCEVKQTGPEEHLAAGSRSSSSGTQLVRHQRWRQQQQQQQQQVGKDIRQYMFKVGDDLRQDQLILQLITVMDTLFKKYGLDLRLTPYKVVALSPRDGMIEFVSKSKTLSSALRENGNNLMTYFKHCAKASNGAQGTESTRLKEILETFSRSCAGYCVITYVLGIGDRHLDNLMVDDVGHMFHVDFGYIFGRDPKPLPPPMKLCKEMVEGMGGQNSEYFRLFRQYCYSAYRILRMNSKLILSLVGLVQGANIKDLVEQDPQMVLSRMEQKLAPEISEEEAESRFLGLINDSTNALFPVVMEKLHQWALYWS